EEVRGLPVPFGRGIGIGRVVEVGHCDEGRSAIRQVDPDAMRRPLEAQVETLVRLGYKGRTDEQAVAVFGPAGPAPDRGIGPLPCGADEAVLLEDVDDLLEAEKVRLEGRH